MSVVGIVVLLFRCGSNRGERGGAFSSVTWELGFGIFVRFKPCDSFCHQRTSLCLVVLFVVSALVYPAVAGCEEVEKNRGPVRELDCGDGWTNEYACHLSKVHEPLRFMNLRKVAGVFIWFP